MIDAPTARRFGLVALAVAATAAAAASGIVYPSSHAPALAGGALVAAVVFVAFVRRPVWALYAALFSVMLPIGLLPATVQSNLNRGLTIIAFAVWLISVIVQRHPITWTVPATFMSAFVAWGLVTLFWANNLDAGLNGIQTYTLRLILYLVLVTNQIRTQESLDGLMKTLMASGWVLVFAGLGTLLFEGYTPGSRFQVLDLNQNEVGILALVALPGVLWQAIRSSGRQRTINTLLSYAFVAIVSVLVVMTGSRGSAISLGIAFAAFSIWKCTRPWAKLGVVLLAVALISMPVLFSTLTTRFALAGGDTALGGREAIWQAAVHVIREHFWGGVGIGGARYAVSPYVAVLRSVKGYGDVAIHNPVLDIWAGTGLVGILLYLGVLMTAMGMFVSQYRRCRRTDSLAPYFALISAVFVGYMASWIKAGGGESDYSYFLMLSLLVVPSRLAIDLIKNHAGNAQSDGVALPAGAGACHPDVVA